MTHRPEDDAVLDLINRRGPLTITEVADHLAGTHWAANKILCDLMLAGRVVPYKTKDGCKRTVTKYHIKARNA